MANLGNKRTSTGSIAVRLVDLLIRNNFSRLKRFAIAVSLIYSLAEQCYSVFVIKSCWFREIMLNLCSKSGLLVFPAIHS